MLLNFNYVIVFFLNKIKIEELDNFILSYVIPKMWQK